MRPRTLGEVAAAVGGAVREGADTTIGGVATDSRAVRPDSLFVALVGERLDGHDFIADALERGAAAVMVRSGFAVEAPAVHVRDTGQALLDLAAEDRRAFEGTVVAITGANGKTSTKDLAGAVVASRWRTHVSPSSFNNEVGLPQTLLGAPPDTDVIVAELGARHVGDVRRLCDVARPQVAVVTNVGLAHMEVFGSWEAIVEASAEPVDALPDDGVAILAADDPVVAGYGVRTRARVVTFGRASDADVRAETITVDRDGRARSSCGAVTNARTSGWRSPGSTWCRTPSPPRPSARSSTCRSKRRRPCSPRHASHAGGCRRAAHRRGSAS